MRRVIVAVLAALLLLSHAEARAQAYPSKPIRFVIPFGAGSATDALARIVGKGMAAALAKPTVREQVERHGFIPKTSTPAALAAYMKEQLAVWKAALKDSGIQPQ